MEDHWTGLPWKITYVDLAEGYVRWRGELRIGLDPNVVCIVFGCFVALTDCRSRIKRIHT